MSKFNNDVLQALEIYNQYLEHNKKTVEKFVGYDPKTKCRYFKKVEVDPAAEVFKKKFIKNRIEKNKPENTKQSRPKKKPSKPVKNTENKEINKIVKAVKPKRKHIERASVTEKKEKIRNYFNNSKSARFISREMNISTSQIYRYLKGMGLGKPTHTTFKNLEFLKQLKDFCRENKTNVFYTSYNNTYDNPFNLNLKQVVFKCKQLEKAKEIQSVKTNTTKTIGLCFKVLDEKKFTNDYNKKPESKLIDVKNKIEDFCKTNKINLFFSTYVKKYDIFPENNARQMETIYKNMEKFNLLTRDKKKVARVFGRCYRVFNNKQFSENLL